MMPAPWWVMHAPRVGCGLYILEGTSVKHAANADDRILQPCLK